MTVLIPTLDTKLSNEKVIIQHPNNEIKDKKAFQESCEEFLTAFNPNELKEDGRVKLEEAGSVRPTTASSSIPQQRGGSVPSSLLERVKEAERNLTDLRRELESLNWSDSVVDNLHESTKDEISEMVELIWESDNLQETRSDIMELSEELTVGEIINTLTEIAIAEIPAKANVNMKNLSEAIELKIVDWLESSTK